MFFPEGQVRVFLYGEPVSMRLSFDGLYFVDVLQRVGQHPASEVHQLTPRLWKPLFAANPLRSDLYGLRS